MSENNNDPEPVYLVNELVEALRRCESVMSGFVELCSRMGPQLQDKKDVDLYSRLFHAQRLARTMLNKVEEPTKVGAA